MQGVDVLKCEYSVTASLFSDLQISEAILVCRMFDLNLLARDASTGKTFVVGLASLPSVHELLEGIKRHVEDKYNLPFPSIPDLFYTHEGLHSTSPFVHAQFNLGDPCLLSSNTLLPETPMLEAPPASPAPLQSSVKSEPSQAMEKVLCSFCQKLISASNFARHERTHNGELRCEGICLYATKNPITMANHKLSDQCLRYTFAAQFLMPGGYC